MIFFSEFPLRLIPAAGHLVALPSHPDIADRHLVLRQRTAFIGAQDGDIAQGLQRGQFFDQHPFLSQPLHTHG